MFILTSLFSVSVMLGTYLLQHESGGHFIFSSLYPGEYTRVHDLTHMDPDKYTPGYDMMLYLLGVVPALSFSTVAVLPIGVIFAPIMIYVVCLRLFGNASLAGMIGLYLTLEIVQEGWYNTFAYSWSRICFLAFLLLLLLSFRTGKSAATTLSLVFIFVGVVFIHYAVPLWMVVLLVATFILGKVDVRKRVPQYWTLAILFVVIYLLVSGVLYDVFLPKYLLTTQESGYSDTLQAFLMKLKSQILGSDIPTGEYVYYVSSGAYGVGRVALNLFLLAGAIVALPSILMRILKTRRISSGSPDGRETSLLYGGLLLVVLIHAAVYGMVTGISQQVLLFLGPVITLLGFARLGWQRWRSVFLAILIVSSMLLIPTSLENETLPLHYSEVKPSSTWLFSHDQSATIRVLSALPYTYYANIECASLDRFLSPYYFSTSSYETLTSGADADLSQYWDYVVVDETSYNRFVGGETLTYYEPLSWHQDQIENNVNLTRVYDDGEIWILKT